MKFTKVKRTYSRSINSKNFGVPESWIKIESTYEAEVESQDDAAHVSFLLHDAAKTDVVNAINEIIDKIKGSVVQSYEQPVPTPPQPAPVFTPAGNNGVPPMPPTPNGNVEAVPTSSPVPVAPIAPPAPAPVANTSPNNQAVSDALEVFPGSEVAPPPAYQPRRL